MFLPSDQTGNQWSFQIHDEVVLNLDSAPEYSGLTEDQSLYGPFTFLPSVPGYSPPNQADDTQLYDPSSEVDFNYSSACAAVYEERVRGYPAPAMDMSDMSHASNTGENKDTLPAHASLPDSMALSITATRATSASRKRRSRNHYCSECGASFDRASRARDCANKDLDQKPYACVNRCLKPSCTAAYSSEKLLNEHLDKRRFRDCPQCGRRLTKKNIARHMQEACY